jgi:hypothetical protein
MRLISYKQPNVCSLFRLAPDVLATKQRHSACSKSDRKERGQRDVGQENIEGNQTRRKKACWREVTPIPKS